MEGGRELISYLVGSLGFGGVLAWYCWYVTSKTLPTLVQEFREETQQIRDASDRQLERVLSEQRSENEKYRATVERMVEQCGRKGVP